MSSGRWQGESLQTEAVTRTFWKDAWHRFRSDRKGLAGGGLVIILIWVAVFAPCLARYDPTYQFREDGWTDSGLPRPSCRKFWLGTDVVGRDVYSRIIFGARVSLGISVLGNMWALGVGLVVGSVGAYCGGRVESVLMGITDTMLAFPVLLFALALGAVLKPSLGTVVLVIGIFYWGPTARIVYGQVLSIKEKDYVTAARCVGVTPFGILVRHVVPQVIPLAIVYFSLGIASAVMVEATLSFLGVGVRPPTPSWGNLVAQGLPYYRTAPWLILYPGVCIMLTVAAFNLLADGLRDALDPYLWGR